MHQCSNQAGGPYITLQCFIEPLKQNISYARQFEYLIVLSVSYVAPSAGFPALWFSVSCWGTCLAPFLALAAIVAVYGVIGSAELIGPLSPGYLYPAANASQAIMWPIVGCEGGGNGEGGVACLNLSDPLNGVLNYTSGDDVVAAAYDLKLGAIWALGTVMWLLPLATGLMLAHCLPKPVVRHRIVGFLARTTALLLAWAGWYVAT